MSDETGTDQVKQTIDQNRPEPAADDAFAAFEKMANEARPDAPSPFDFHKRSSSESAAQEDDKPKRQRDAKGRFIKKDDEEPPDKGPAAPELNRPNDSFDKEQLDSMGKFKSRLEREKRKQEAKDKKIEELNAEIESLKKRAGAQDNQGGASEDDPGAAQSGSDGGPMPEPKREDFADGEDGEEAYLDAMLDWYEQEDAEDEQGKTQAKDSQGQEGQVQGKSEGERKEDARLTGQQDATRMMWDDILEVLDEAEGEGVSETLVEDLDTGLKEGKLLLTESMVEWLLDNEEDAAHVVQKMIEKPRLSRKAARSVGARQRQVLQEIAGMSHTGSETNQAANPSPDITQTRGASRAPGKPLEDMSFREFENHANSRAKDQGGGFYF